MHHPPQPSTYGQTVAFHRSLFEGLRRDGYSIPDLLKMSVREALLARYGSAEAVDQMVGPGTYRGVQQCHGGLSQWRKPWSRVRKEQEALYLAKMAALEVLKGSIETCKASGATNQEITVAVQTMLCQLSRGQASRRDH